MSAIPSDFNLFSCIPDELLREIVSDAFKNSGNFNMRLTCTKWNILLDPIIQQCWNNFKNVSIRAQMIEDKNAQSEQPQNYKESFRALHQCFKKEFSLGSSPIAPIVVPDQYFAYENDSLMKLWEKAIWPQIRDKESVPKLDNPHDVRQYLRSTDLHIREILNGIETLHANNIDLNCIPEEIRFLPNLKNLMVGRNHLTVLPAFLGDLKKLRHLDFGYNSLNEFPDTFVKWDHIERLDVLANSLNKCGRRQLHDWAECCHMTRVETLLYAKAYHSPQMPHAL